MPTIHYQYDPGSRLVRIGQDAGAANNNVAQAVMFDHDKANRRVLTRLPNGISLHYSYDDADQLTAIAYKNADGSVLGDLWYAYDAGGQRIASGGSFARMSLPESSIAPATVDAANRLTSVDGVPVTHDENGNLTSDGTNSYVWNVRGQLVQIKDANGAVTAAFSYDALGRRQAKTVAGQGVGYVYDGQNIVQMLDGTSADNSQPGNVLASYITGLGLDQLYAASAGTGAAARTTSYLTDALGSTLRLTDVTGAKIADYTYDVYGTTSVDTPVDNSFQYTGRENDQTGLYYYRARYYSPKLARFIQSDPTGLQGGINTYSYVEGNPLQGIDPQGLQAMPNAFAVPLQRMPLEFGPPAQMLTSKK